MKYIKFIILILISVFSIYARAQSLSYRKTNHIWEPNSNPSISVDSIFKNEDAVILFEKCIYNISGNHVPPYNFLNASGNLFFIDESSQGRSPIVQKHVRIKFLNIRGIENFSTITLPESFDPQHEILLTPPEKRNSVQRIRGEFDCVRYFAARIHKADGRIDNAKILESTEEEVQPRNGNDQTFYSWIFKITNLEPGDELELNYSYEGIYTINPSYRIFFNGEMPKQNYHLTFRENLNQIFMHFDHNGAKATDSIIVKSGLIKYRDYNYKAQNLKGGISETGGRPANELPYISYYNHNSDYGESEPGSPVITNMLPYPWWFVLSKSLGFQIESLPFKLAWNDQTTVTINKFLEEERSKNNFSSNAALMSSIQHSIAEEWRYDSDIDYLEGFDKKLEKLGKNVANKKLRYISRNKFYQEIFLRLDTEYFAAVVPDKRFGDLDPNQYEYNGFRSIFFALPVQNEYLFFYPKGSRFGYEANEFPFYHEDVTSALIPQHLPVSMKNDILPRVNYPFIHTPNSSYKENTRKTSAVLNASLETLSISVNGKLKLTGQFSTLTRGYYLFGAKDTTINTAYYKAVGNPNDTLINKIFSKESTSTKFPFEANFNFNFDKPGFISKENENVYSFSFDNWFNNIIDDEFSAVNRRLNYYPDFKSEDVHRFMLQFDQPVILLDVESLRDTISNAYGYYLVSAEQKDGNKILIETKFLINSDMISPSKAHDVDAIFNKIRSWNSKKFRVKKV
jgi:hypothetical protein